jgi:hypothetical protein
MEPQTKEDAVKRVLKRIDDLHKGTLGELNTASEACTKQVYETGDPEHLDRCFVRWQKDENDEASYEFFYVCKKCLSDFVMKHPDAMDNNVVVLRGNLTKEARDMMIQRAKEQWEKNRTEEEKREEEIQEMWRSDKPCPICGKKFSQHDDDQLYKCTKDFVVQNPPDESGGTNKA